MSATGAVALTGATPGDLQREGLGIFTRRPEDVNGWPSYVREGDESTMLWHAGRSWLVGLASDVGKTMGCVSAPDGALEPDKVAAPWRVWRDSDSEWVDAPGLSCISGAALTAALAAAPVTVALTGATPGNLQRERPGIFTRRPEDVNGWPSYVRGGDESMMLWHAGRCWYVGLASDVGKTMGWVSAPDGALEPDKVAAPWQVWRVSDKQWIDAPGLSCISGAALTAVLAAAPATVALTGATPGDLQRERLGIFTRRPEDVNGWPSYVRGGDESTMLWHASRGWLVGLASDVGKDMGHVSAPDGALEPDKVAAPWRVWRVRDKQWIDAPSLRCTAEQDGGDDGEPVVIRERTRQQRDAEARKQAIDLEALPASKRPKTEPAGPSSAASSSAAASTSGTAGVERVTGLDDLLENQSNEVCAAALAWCVDNEVKNVKLICDAEADDAFVDALPIKPTGIPAIALRKRLAKLRQAA